MIREISEIIADYCGYKLVYNGLTLIDVKFPNFYVIQFVEGELVTSPCLTS
jgi:hypothetical protein